MDLLSLAVCEMMWFGVYLAYTKYTFTSQHPFKGSQSMSINGNLEAGTETKGMFTLFPYCNQGPLAEEWPPTHSGLGLPRLGINQENTHRGAYSTI